MLNAAIVGLGSWGQILARSVHGKSDRIRIVRAATRTVSKAEAFARETGIPVGDDFTAVLEDASVEAVILATPHSQHVEQVVAAAARGKHVFVEKPLALDVAGVEAAFEACEKAEVVLAVGQNRRFLPAVARIKDLVQEGALGKLLHVEGNYSGPSGFRHARSTWRSSHQESPWGGMTGRGLHMSDLMISFLGTIREVDARSFRQVLQTEMDDTTVSLLRFETGATGYLGTLTATGEEWRWQLFGSKGWAEIRNHTHLTLSFVEGGSRTESFAEVDIERAELEAFADAVEGKAAYPVPRADVVNNIAFLEAIGRSIAASGPVRIA